MVVIIIVYRRGPQEERQMGKLRPEGGSSHAPQAELELSSSQVGLRRLVAYLGLGRGTLLGLSRAWLPRNCPPRLVSFSNGQGCREQLELASGACAPAGG